MTDAKLNLTAEQKVEIKKVVGHDLDTVTPDIGNVGGLKLTLTDSQAAEIKSKTGKDLKILDLSEDDLKQYSSIACYERGGIVIS